MDASLADGPFWYATGEEDLCVDDFVSPCVLLTRLGFSRGLGLSLPLSLVSEDNLSLICLCLLLRADGLLTIFGLESKGELVCLLKKGSDLYNSNLGINKGLNCTTTGNW